MKHFFKESQLVYK